MTQQFGLLGFAQFAQHSLCELINLLSDNGCAPASARPKQLWAYTEYSSHEDEVTITFQAGCPTLSYRLEIYTKPRPWALELTRTKMHEYAAEPTEMTLEELIEFVDTAMLRYHTGIYHQAIKNIMNRLDAELV